MQKDNRDVADAIMEKKPKAKRLGHPWGLKRATWPSAATCNVNDWMLALDEEHLVRRWGELMTFMLASRSKVALMFNTLVEVVDDIGNREHCGFIEAPLEACHPQGVGVLMKEATKVLCTQQWQEHPEVTIDQYMQGEVSEWRYTCQSLKTRKQKMQ